MLYLLAMNPSTYIDVNEVKEESNERSIFVELNPDRLGSSPSL